jgi:nitrogen fixation NifU-like protein
MSDLRELYQELILDHTKRPRNFGPLAGANRKAEGFNPLCGDRVSVSLELDGETVRDVHFEGTGCAISTASASLMTEALKGRTVDEAEALFEDVHELLTGNESSSGEGLGKLVVLGGVRAYPMRVKCATLAWHTFRSALHDQGVPVTTE